jgi:hypothetical protein
MGRGSLPARFIVLTMLAGSLLLGADKPNAKPAEKDKAFTLTNKWAVLVNPTARIRGRRPLPENGPIQSLQELKFTGPKPKHPFVLGEFAADGEFGLVDGALQLTSGGNAVVQLPEADEFELEGIMDHTEYGGWFMAVGWDTGRGYVISNVTMKDSGSPWYVSELRGSSTVPDGTEELEHFEWLKTQPFRLSVSKKELTLEVGERTVADHVAMPHYEKGRVLLGVYNTRYGPKKLRVQSLRMRVPPEDPKKK